MLKRHQIRVFSTILFSVVSAATTVANSAYASPTNQALTGKRQPQSNQVATSTSSAGKTPSGKPQSKSESRSTADSSGDNGDGESHLHGWIPTGKRSFNAVEELTMDDPVIEEPDDEPIVLQQQTAKVAVPEGVLQKGYRVDALPHYNLANKYLNQGRLQDAARKYRDAITVYDKEADFYVNLGVALRKLNDFTAAEDAFKQALALNSADWMAWSNLANAYLKQDKLVETVDSFKQCLKCKPPAQERAAIEQDIKDITKILRMRDPNFDKKPSVASNLTETSKQAKGNTKGTAEKASKPQAPLTKTSAPAKQASSATQVTPVSPDKLQGSGWDYVYK